MILANCLTFVEHMKNLRPEPQLIDGCDDQMNSCNWVLHLSDVYFCNKDSFKFTWGVEKCLHKKQACDSCVPKLESGHPKL